MSITMSRPEYVTTEDVAELLGIHVKSIRRWAADGLLPRPIRVGRGRHMRWRREVIEQYLRDREGDHAPR